MPSPEYDLRYLKAGIEQLESYLLSSDVYWSIGTRAPAGETPYPQLTLGVLLLARLRAQSSMKTSTQQVELEELNGRLNDLRTRWRVAWEGKASKEYHARLNLWKNFLEEYRANPETQYDRYKYEVTRRVILDLLGAETENIPQTQRDLLASLDLLLHTIFISGKFIWDISLDASFPQDQYWYLYGRVPKSLQRE
ncbi:MAG: hypothetical protein WBD56_00610 [Anaerolineales bacterium]